MNISQFLRTIITFCILTAIFSCHNQSDVSNEREKIQYLLDQNGFKPITDLSLTKSMKFIKVKSLQEAEKVVQEKQSMARNYEQLATVKSLSNARAKVMNCDEGPYEATFGAGMFSSFNVQYTYDGAGGFSNK